jgi:hypothetical protein
VERARRRWSGLPSWNVHRYWSRRLGLSDELSEEVDRIIDSEGEFEGFRVAHDWIKGPIGGFVMAVWLFYKKFGVEGVRAMMLHGVLDYMASLSRMGFDSEEILWRTIAWVKFAGAKHVVDYVSRLPKGERLPWVLNQDWDYYNYFDLDSQLLHLPPNLREVALRVAKELVDFVMENFDEMLASVKAG